MPGGHLVGLLYFLSQFTLSSYSGVQCCQLSNFVAKFSNFSDYPSNFFFHLATNLAIFKKLIWQLLATFDK